MILYHMNDAELDLFIDFFNLTLDRVSACSLGAKCHLKKLSNTMANQKLF